MDITTRLQLLDTARRAHQANTAMAAADSAFHRSARATAQALASTGACEQQLAATFDLPQAMAASTALDRARAADLDCTVRHRKAQPQHHPGIPRGLPGGVDQVLPGIPRHPAR